MVRRAFAPQLLVIFVWIAIIGVGSALTSAGGLVGHSGAGRDAGGDVASRASDREASETPEVPSPPAAPAVIARPSRSVPEPAATAVPTPSPSPAADGGGCDNSEPLPMVVGEETTEITGGIVDSFVLESAHGPVTILLTDQTIVRGDLSTATDVQVDGVFQEDGSIVATTVKVRCPRR